MRERDIWRLIESGDCPASYNMALDEALAVFARRGEAPATLRLYGWDRASVSLGRFQRVSDIDTEYCIDEGIPVVRRPTGGRGVLHGDELTYSFSAGAMTGSFSVGLIESCRNISRAFVMALKLHGIDADMRQKPERGSVLAGSPICFQSSSIGEVMFEGRKIIGSAQKRWTDGLLQQGSLPFSYDVGLLEKVFRTTGDAGFSNIMTAARTVNPDLSKEAFGKTLTSVFEDLYRIRFVKAQPSDQELALALQLQEEKYLNGVWTNERK